MEPRMIEDVLYFMEKQARRTRALKTIPSMHSGQRMGPKRMARICISIPNFLAFMDSKRVEKSLKVAQKGTRAVEPT